MIRVETYAPAHLTKLRVKTIHQGEMSPEIKTRAITLLQGEDVLAIFGGCYLCPSVIHLWAFVSPIVSKYPLAFHKKSLELLEFLAKTEAPRRIQFDVRVSYHEGADWAESLGFKREGVMKKFAPDGEDCWLYARTVNHVGF